MDYSFKEKADVKLITLFIIENFKMPVPNSYIVDTLTLEHFINYFDLQNEMGELEEDELITYYIEDDTRYYSLSEKGRQTLEYFSSKIPKTVRERLIRAIKIKIKDLKNALSIKADYEKINEIEYKVSLGISEGNFDMFNISISVSDELLAKKMCAAFKNDPQTLYSEFLSVLTKNI